MAQKSLMWKESLFRACCAFVAVVLIGGSVMLADDALKFVDNMMAVPREGRKTVLKLDDFGPVSPTPKSTPMLTQTSVSHDPTGPITPEADDPIPSSRLTGVITVSRDSGIVSAQVYNGTDLTRHVWLIAWQERSVSRRVKIDMRHAFVNQRETVTLFLPDDRAVNRYQLVAALPDADVSLDMPSNHESLAERLIER